MTNPGQSAVTTMTFDSHGNLCNWQESGFTGSEPIIITNQYTCTASGRIAARPGVSGVSPLDATPNRSAGDLRD